VKCRDSAYRQIVVQDATEHGIEPGDFIEVEVLSGETVYAFGEPVSSPTESEEAAAAD
jgi:hypothetical protein